MAATVTASERKREAQKFNFLYNKEIKEALDGADRDIDKAEGHVAKQTAEKAKKERILAVQKKFQQEFVRRHKVPTKREEEAVLLYEAAAKRHIRPGMNFDGTSKKPLAINAPWVICADELITRKQLARRPAAGVSPAR